MKSQFDQESENGKICSCYVNGGRETSLTITTPTDESKYSR